MSFVINPYAFGKPPWTPSNMSTQFWYDAADASTLTVSNGFLDAWADKSGNNLTLTVNTANSSAPNVNNTSLNGLNVVEWLGVMFQQDIGTNSFAWDQASSLLFIAMVWQYNSFGNETQYFLYHTTGTTVAGARMSQRITSSNRFEILGGSGAGVNQTFASSIIPSLNTPTLSVCKLNAGSSAWHVNGTTSGTGNVGTNSLDRLRFGHNENFAFHLDGFIAEVVGFTSGTERPKVEGYLAWKWGLQANLDAMHPYKNAAPLQ